ncbi:histone deacetylase complex subunit Rxt2 [Yamadazyma tenuis]|uniref:Transcriptional regulatory protein RXT2 N-terminal domain-containing protein n=1 Tax=Candida tenuis (strain ATCC 10573 / BCRC 21748 / CBS 615 / JCM 9827 / NBRC 10315 / NRRL Y-1498 / VKM Y-70) TaxID=590646 RepID=G3BCA9_CANTC|nr:uncharacterized protein CANTEDRAFT_116224 [Yamadazyma tenuis ATCC 10573]EGV61036.1 hypothetical protein CANTEDRAFT_116224 [Yamadazyma tenuis ATCC 10573]WEJ94605.1 histone deacetylase complex subunit Rxt2 [Yamadazyma tenuis]
MLDEKSIAVITRFKQALANDTIPVAADSHILDSNRGQKLVDEIENDDHLRTKVVEFNGTNYLVSSNRKISSSTRRNKRRWQEYYESTDEFKKAKSQSQAESSDVDDGDEASHEDNEIDDNDEGSETGGGDDDRDYDEDLNPLHDFNVTEILSPLSHPSEIISHPVLSGTFKSEALSKLATELIEVIESEQNTLNWFNKLLQVLNGEDWYYLLEENLGLPKYDHGLVNDEEPENPDKKPSPSQNGAPEPEGEVKKEDENGIPKRITRKSNAEVDDVSDPFFMLPDTLKKYEMHQARVVEEPEPGKESELEHVQEDLINHLQVSIQRQQEHIKNLMKLRENIVRADRLKTSLWKWGKEMYDKKSS